MGFIDDMKEMLGQLWREADVDRRLQVDDFMNGGDSFQERNKKRHCIDTATSITLNDVLMTDIKGFGCVAMLDSPPVEELFGRSYCTGHLQYGDYTLQAKFSDYDSWLIGDLSIDGEGAEELHQKILERQKRRAPILYIRKLTSTTFEISVRVFGVFCFFMLCTFHFKAFFLGIFCVMFLFLVQNLARKYLR